jgi:hypothetical protein
LSQSVQPFKPVLLDLLRQSRLDREAFVAGLSPAERGAAGTPQLWSARDHVVHMTFWRQRFALKLRAIAEGRTPDTVDDFEEANARVFEEQRHRPWPQVIEEADRADAEVSALLEEIGEEDLVVPGRFAWMPEDAPLYHAVTGNIIAHTWGHLAQFHADRHDRSAATAAFESGVERLLRPEVPAWLQGNELFNLACFYATHDQVERAPDVLRRALALRPDLEEWSRKDPDLAALRTQPA